MTDEKTMSIIDATKNGLVQINMKEVKEQVADQLKAFLLNMMPKEAFDQVIDVAWKNLTEPRPEVKKPYGQNTPAKPSELEEMVQVAMREELKKKVATWQIEWAKTDSANIAAKAAFSELVAKASGEFIHRVGVQIVNEAASILSEQASISYVHCRSCSNRVVSGTTCSCGTYN